MKWWTDFKAWITNKLVPEAKSAWKWFSMQMMALAVGLQACWAALDADTKAHLPAALVTYTTIGLLLLGLGGRLIKQGTPAP